MQHLSLEFTVNLGQRLAFVLTSVAKVSVLLVQCDIK
jgi:hypothetical protein